MTKKKAAVITKVMETKKEKKQEKGLLKMKKPQKVEQAMKSILGDFVDTRMSLKEQLTVAV